MLEDILAYMAAVDTGWIYLILFFFSFIENVFPPSPSDVVVIVGASLIASTTVGFLPVLFITSFGSAMGFILMYYIGKLFGDRVVRSGKIKFITEEELSKTDIWFTKYGYKLITANRFLPGTRSIISFFAGMYELDVYKTFFLASISAFAWNVIIIYLGMELGNNVDVIDYYLSTYSTVITIATIVIAAVFIIRYIYIKKKKK
ncbi:MAG: DedA family protein [Melioribacteraceae bacterium]|nr:DedA family protein [Melioribacteraceae bacterium]